MQRPSKRTSVRSISTLSTAALSVLAFALCAVAPPPLLAGFGKPSPIRSPYALVADIDKDGQPGGVTNPVTADQFVIRLSEPLTVIAAFFAGDQGIARLLLDNNPNALVDVAALSPTPTTDSASADLDCDGDEDLLVVDFEFLSCILQQSGGTFAAPVPCAQISGSPFGENCVKVTDLTGDQCPDITSVSNTFQNPNNALIQVFPNNGSGVFLPPTTITIPGATISANAVGDIDADGNDEVAVIRGSSSVSILRRTAPSTLTPLNATTGQPLAPTDPFTLSDIDFSTTLLFEITLSDVNKDANADILVSNLNDIFIRPSLGNGTFGPIITLDGDSGTRNIAVADFNNDGTAEVFATNPNTDSINLWRSTGPLQWATKVDLPVGTSPSGVLAVDANEDSLLDIIAVNRIDGDAVIFLNTGTGDFFAPQRFSTSLASPGGYTSVASGDFNADGYADVFASTQRGELHLFPNAADGSGRLLAPITRRISFNPFVVAAVPAPPGLAGDGRDRVAAAFIGRREIVVLKYDETRPPTNPFETIQTFFAAEITPDTVNSISTCDFNADGITDIAVTLDNAPGVGARVFPGLATGLFDTLLSKSVSGGGWEKFIVPRPSSGLPSNTYFVTDFQTGNTLELIYSAGTFNYGRQFSVGAACTDIDLAQTDADAIADLVAVRTGTTDGTVTIQRGLTAPVLPASGGFTIPRNPAGLAVGDLDADGRDDLLISTAGPVNQNQYVISILSSSSGLRPETATLHPAGERPARPILADLHNPVPSRGGTPTPRAGPEAIIPNRDATGFSFNATVMVLPNQIEAAPPPLACRADFNTDGVVSTPDLVFFLGRFGEPATPGSPAERADFNNDGVVNTPDLVFFLGRFGETCP